MADTWMKIGSALLCYNIGALHPIRTASHQPKSFKVDQFRTCSQLTDIRFQLSGRALLKKSTRQSLTPGRRPRAHTIYMHEAYLT